MNTGIAIATLTKLSSLEDTPRHSKVDISFHGADAEQATAIVKRFPDAFWQAHAIGSTEWLDAQVGSADERVEITIFLDNPPAPDPEPTISQQILDGLDR